MTDPNQPHGLDASGAEDAPATEEGPQSVPPRIWVTLVGFAAFVILFGTCAANWMFN